MLNTNDDDTYTANLTVLMFEDWRKLRSCLLCSFLHVPITYSVSYIRMFSHVRRLLIVMSL